MATFNLIVADRLSMTVAPKAKLLFSLFKPKLYPKPCTGLVPGSDHEC